MKVRKTLDVTGTYCLFYRNFSIVKLGTEWLFPDLLQITGICISVYDIRSEAADNRYRYPISDLINAILIV